MKINVLIHGNQTVSVHVANEAINQLIYVSPAMYGGMDDVVEELDRLRERMPEINNNTPVFFIGQLDSVVDQFSKTRGGGSK